MWGPDRWGARRLLSHIRGLPPDSALHRATAPVWTQADELAATTVDRLADLTYVVLTALGGKPDKPARFPRPATARPDTSPAAAAAAADGKVVSLSDFARIVKEPTRGR